MYCQMPTQDMCTTGIFTLVSAELNVLGEWSAFLASGASLTMGQFFYVSAHIKLELTYNITVRTMPSHILKCYRKLAR